MSHNKEFDILKKITAKPEIWSAYTGDFLWTDEYISRNMLKYHLDPHSEPASRPHDFIDRSVSWIKERFDLASGLSVIDFGCGPGLYTSRFCSAGAEVTGIDFSERSLNYARTQSQKANQNITYIQGNYLNVDLDEHYDLVTMIYCDFCALSPEQRQILLRNMKSILKEGGKVFFDVFSARAYDSREEVTAIKPDLMGGFWSAEDYIGISQTWKYDDDKVILDKYDIFSAEGSRTVYNWLQYFTQESLEREITSHGFRIMEWCSDVSGRPLENGSSTMAVVLEVDN